MLPNLKIYWETKLKSRFHANDTLLSAKRTSNPFLLEISSCKCGADWPDPEMGQRRISDGGTEVGCVGAQGDRGGPSPSSRHSEAPSFGEGEGRGRSLANNSPRDHKKSTRIFIFFR